MTVVLHYQNQGTAIAPNLNNTAGLRDWTSIIAPDGERFAPPNDRNGYSDGVDRRMNTGGVLMAGIPVDRFVFPWISDSQIKYLYTTINGGAESGNVTVKIHTSLSVGRLDTFSYNAVMNLNLNQTNTLTRERNGYKLFVVELVLVEPL